MSSIQRSAELLAETLRGKNQDYTADRGEFFNFQKAAEIANTVPFDVMIGQIGIKVTRLESLVRGISAGQTPNNEGLKDTLLDLAGYSIIAHAYLSQDDEVNYG